MYTPAVMQRNLGVGNICEAFFRAWYERNVERETRVATLEHYGYNPDGLVVGREKVEMLKQLRESPDYVLLSTTDATARTPVLGISVNSQNSLYTMHHARAPWLCHACSRGVQQACYEKKIGNLWFNRYNIDNDYRGFVGGFGVDVALVTVVASWFRSVFEKVKEEGLEPVALSYIRHGRSPPPGVTSTPASETGRLIELLMNQNRGRTARKYVLYWMPYKRVIDGSIPYSIAGGQGQYGRPREVVCVDATRGSDEQSLIQTLRAI